MGFNGGIEIWIKRQRIKYWRWHVCVMDALKNLTQMTDAGIVKIEEPITVH